MNKRIIIYAIVSFLFGCLLVTTLSGQSKGVFDPDVELKIPGLVCPSCAIGIKNGFKKTNQIKEIKFDTKKETCQIEFISIEIHPSQMRKIVKNAGYELKSIKWLKDKKPNRYNKP
tara:strand:- start:125 stop:472 length:348 start_codon:yes stop_codon:yes gene_type:complete